MKDLAYLFLCKKTRQLFILICSLFILMVLLMYAYDNKIMFIAGIKHLGNILIILGMIIIIVNILATIISMLYKKKDDTTWKDIYLQEKSDYILNKYLTDEKLYKIQMINPDVLDESTIKIILSSFIKGCDLDTIVRRSLLSYSVKEPASIINKCIHEFSK